MREAADPAPMTRVLGGGHPPRPVERESLTSPNDPGIRGSGLGAWVCATTHQGALVGAASRPRPQPTSGSLAACRMRFRRVRPRPRYRALRERLRPPRYAPASAPVTRRAKRVGSGCATAHGTAPRHSPTDARSRAAGSDARVASLATAEG